MKQELFALDFEVPSKKVSVYELIGGEVSLLGVTEGSKISIRNVLDGNGTTSLVVVIEVPKKEEE